MNADIQERVWAEVNLDNLVHNFNTVKTLAGRDKAICVIKADAYGHGAARAAKALAGAGAGYFAVATPEEAAQLRRHGITQPVLLLGAAAADIVPLLADMDVSASVGDLAAAKEYSQKLGSKKLKVHIKIETGLNRTGLNAGEAVSQVLEIAAMPGLLIEGIFTHLPAADDDGEFDFTNAQISALHNIAADLNGRGLSIPVIHFANSAAIMCSGAYTDTEVFNYCRPGIMLYGCNPCLDAMSHPADIKPVMSLRARITQVKRVGGGESVGYGRAWFARRDSVIATVGVGYADGLPRSLSGKISMLLGGRRAPQIGRICMDMCMLDVTDIPGVSPGCVATIMGSDGAERVTADDLAAAANTIPHEIFCATGKRVRRFYFQNGKPVGNDCYIDSL